MKVLNLVQGSKEWKEHRANAFNASDAPAMLGVSKYKTRNDLLKERVTGITPEIDDATQRIFNDGHSFEALARPIAEGIIGDDLSPVTGVQGEYSASFDGITFDQSIIWEHKTLNADIRKAIGANGNAGGLSEMLRIQMEQQLMISGAEKCLFMASKWDGETLSEEVHGWYMPDLVLRDKIMFGWNQFAKDLATYQHVEEVAAPVAEIIMGLPAVSVQATGMVTASNLPEFKKAADTFIANIKTELVTDEDFVNAEANVKFCKSAEDDLEGAKKSMLAQTSSINEVIQTIDFIKGQLASKRLMLDKLVKSEKESRKLAIIGKAKEVYADHYRALEAEIKPIVLMQTMPDFAGAMKGLKKLSAMQEAVDTVLRNAVFEADKVAKDIRAKLAWCKENASGHSALFPDLQNLMSKPMEDFTLTITSRIEKQKADEAARLEAERAKMQAEEEAKARAKVDAENEEIRRREAMLTEASKLPKIPEERVGEIIKSMSINESVTSKESLQVKTPIKDSVAAYPGDQAIIKAIQSAYGVSFGDACDWIVEAAESMKVAA